MKTALITLTITLASLSANADSLKLSIDVTQHLNTQKQYSDVHFMAEYQKGDYSVGVYNNSIGRVSLYAGKRFNMGNGYSVGLGLVTGYDFPIAPAMQVTKALTSKSELFIFPSAEISTKNNVKIAPVIGYRVFIN